jgi:hypothetical protein
MKDAIIWVLLLALTISNGFLFIKLQGVESKVAGYDSKVQSWDKAVEILEDCLEYNTFGECKQKYPQYRGQFQ